MRVANRAKVLLGRISVQLLIVDGPDKLTDNDRTRIVAFCADACKLLREHGLRWARKEQPRVTDDICQLGVTVRLATFDPGPPPAKTGNRETDKERQEMHWLPNLVKGELGLNPLSMGREDLGEALAEEADKLIRFPVRFPSPVDTCTLIVTTHPTGWYAYARPHKAYAVVQWRDTVKLWPKSIDRVIAHELGHIFGGIDEYVEADGSFICQPSTAGGIFGVRNNNCALLRESVPCLMRSNEAALCDWTPLHWGWQDIDEDGRVDILTRLPQITTVDPPNARALSFVSLDGPGLHLATRVFFDGVPSPEVTVVGTDELFAQVPAGPDGTLGIVVQTIAGHTGPAVFTREPATVPAPT